MREFRISRPFAVYATQGDVSTMRPKILLSLFLIVLAGTLTAAPRRRAASPDRCSEIVSPPTLSFPAAGGHASVALTIAGGCEWSPVASASWITAAPAAGGVSVDVSANTATTARTGLIHVRGSVIVVTQAANQIPNLVSNAGFDSGLSGWSDAFSGGGSATWANPTPILSPPGASAGTALITSTQAGAGFQLSQCVSVIGGKTYEGGVKALIPAGQSHGVVNFAVYEYWVPNCPAPSVPYHQKRELSAASPTGTWFDQSVVWSTDFATKSVLVVIGAGGSSTPPFSAYFDDVFVREKP